MPYQLLIAHCRVCDFGPDVYFIGFVPVWLFCFVSESLQTVYTKSMYFCPTISYVIYAKQVLFVLNMHAFDRIFVVSL